MPLFTTIGGALVVLGLIAVASTMGLTGIFLAPIEFVGVLGSILSYLRLAALGWLRSFWQRSPMTWPENWGALLLGLRRQL